MSRHVIEASGKTRIVIENGEIKEIGEPQLEYCPVQDIILGVKRISVDSIKQGITLRIERFGMCTPRRVIELDDDLVAFGASEIFSSAVRSGLLDAVVQVCDGAGTVVAADSRVVQGIGGAMSGLAETSPIPEVIRKLKTKGCIILDEANATIDQAKGLELAFEKYDNVGVTVCNLDDAKRCREVEAAKQAAGEKKSAVLFGVHVTGMSEAEAKKFMELVDLVTACASKHVRHLASNALLQLGVAVPIFVLSEKGKEVALNRIKHIKRQILIKTGELPELPEGRQPRPLL
ncbi:MAG: DUF2099 domain protein [Candidatus Alkanophagales archaeon MCA70_species_2]|nr:DUF2099 domain protein [Candidatus Alkanophaga liquidiphilum]